MLRKTEVQGVNVNLLSQFELLEGHWVEDLNSPQHPLIWEQVAGWSEEASALCRYIKLIHPSPHFLAPSDALI